MKKNQLAMTVLDRALTTKRPHKAFSTIKFCSWLEKLLPEHTVDGCGNIHVDLRAPNSKSLFVAHVDTVHRTGGKNKVIKTDKLWSASGAPLGADDGAGVAILMHMIGSRVPGYYIFTQGEEVGGIGAKWLADNMPDLLKQFSRAIAFDRRATYSVITHQGWDRCASEEFADTLSDVFNRLGMLYAGDDTGVYTDTAEFTRFIPECTNISAGYDMEHSERETLDMEHFTELLRCVTKIQWDSLPIVRDPAAREPEAMFDSSWFANKRWGKSAGYGTVKKSYKATKPVSDTKGTPVSRSVESDEWSHNPVYEDYIAAHDMEFNNAMDRAFDGDLTLLVTMMARTANPESPRSAEKQICKRLMTEAFLIDLMDDAYIMDTHDLLMDAFNDISTVVN